MFVVVIIIITTLNATDITIATAIPCEIQVGIAATTTVGMDIIKYHHNIGAIWILIIIVEMSICCVRYSTMIGLVEIRMIIYNIVIFIIVAAVSNLERNNDDTIL